MPASHAPRPRRRRVLALGAAAAVLLTTAGCGGEGDKGSPQPPPAPTAAPVSPDQLFADLRAAAATGPTTAATLSAGLATSGKLEGEAGSAAAELRSALASGLVEHVALAGLAALSEYRFGTSSPQATAAVSALQANGAAVADVVARGASEDREQFAAAWGERVTAVLAYASAADDGDAGQSARQAASTALAANAKKLGTVFADATDGVLSTAAVQRQFVTAATRVTAVLDALGSGDPVAAKRLRAADEQAADVAEALAAGLDRSGGLAGDPSQPAAELRADLAGLFTEGAYLTGWTTFLTVTSPEGASAPVVVAARDASDTNAQALATAVGAAIGRDKQAGFISVWRDAVDNLNTYATVEESSRAAAGARLAAFPANAASFLADASGGSLAAADVTAVLTSAVQALIKAVDGLRTLKDVPATGDPEPSVSAAPTP